MKLLEHIISLKKKNKTLLIAIDGRGGSGKSTLAKYLGQKLSHATIVHLDDFAYPLGGADRQRLLDQVILPLKKNKQARYQRYDWNTKKLAEQQIIQPGGFVIIEGVLTLHDLIVPNYDFKIWIECPAEIGFQRGLSRDKKEYGVDTTKEWIEKWLPEEKKGIAEQKPQKKADYIVDALQMNFL